MKYKLIASDLDGTLVDEEGRLSERTRKAILRATEAGIIFVTATGRPFHGVGVTNKLFDRDMPFITLNGAAVYMGKSKELLSESFLDFALAKEAFDIGQASNRAQVVWTGSRLWVNRICEWVVRYQAFYTDLETSLISDLSELGEYKNRVSKVLWLSEPTEVENLRHEMSAFFGSKLNCFSSLPYILEFVSPNVSKGIALAEVGKRFGIDSSEMIAFGDAYNDVSMFEYVGCSVAMENAPDDIKEMCDHVTLSNDNDGVAIAIEQFVLD